MALTSQLAWVLRGGARTDTALQSLGADLRELQLKVDALSLRLDEVDSRLAVGVYGPDIERLESSVDSMRLQLRQVTDDLGDRVGAVAARLDASN